MVACVNHATPNESAVGRCWQRPSDSISGGSCGGGGHIQSPVRPPRLVF